MLKRKARQLKRAAAVSATASRSKRNIVAVVALLLCLSVASGILARWRASHFAARLRPVAATAPTTASGSNPSKEYIYAGEKLVATEEPTPSTARVNYALGINGGVASASSVAGAGFEASAANNGDRKGANWGAGGGWLDAPPQSVFPEWLQIDFNSTKTIHQVDVFMVQDSYAAPVAPTQSMTFTLYGLTDFKVQSWNGTGWTDIPGASATGNNLVWKRFSFPDVSTSKIRLVCTGSVDGWSRVIELQAWGN